MSTVPVFSPTGELGDIPADQLHAAVLAGAKPGIHIKSPDGSDGIVPADRSLEAVKAGAKLVPIQEQPAKSFWSEAGSALWGDLKGMVAGSAKLAMHGMESASGMPQNLAEDIANQGSQMKQNWKARTAAGEGLPYKVGAAANEALGVNVTGEEQAAKEGNPGAVVGHAAAVPAVMAASAGLAKGTEIAAPKVLETAGKVADAVSVTTPKQAAQVIGGAGGAGLGHGALSVPGAYYGAKGAGSLVESVLGKERANSPIIAAKAGPGAPLPEVPPAEVLQAAKSGLAKGGHPIAEQSDALGKIVNSWREPAETPSVGAQPAPSSEVSTPAGTLPLEIAKLSPKQLETLLNQGLGGKGLEPNVPIGKQGGVMTPKTVGTAAGAIRDTGIMAQVKSDHPDWSLSQQLQEAAKIANPSQSSPGAIQVKTNVRSAQGLEAGGKTYVPSGGPEAELSPQPRTAPPARESSAVNAFRYDPDANEMHITWKGGAQPVTYVYGEVTPAQSEMFHSAESKGMAAKSIKDNNVLVAKIINGKRIPVKPVISPEDSISPEEWQAGHELSTAVEGSRR